MLISRENNGVNLNFFASKEAYPIVRQLEKIMVKKAQAKVVKYTKNKSWVHTNLPPLGHVSVKIHISKVCLNLSDFTILYDVRGMRSSAVELWIHDLRVVSLNSVWAACCVLEQSSLLLTCSY